MKLCNNSSKNGKTWVVPSYSVNDPVDVFHVQSRVRDFAQQMGFSRLDSQELAIVASELASNILKYGKHGELLVQALASDHGPCLEIVAVDYGPPFENLEAALQDGWDGQGPIDPAKLLRRSGIGGGLGAIVRFTDSFKVEQTALGKQVITRRFVGPQGSRRPPKRVRA